MDVVLVVFFSFEVNPTYPSDYARFSSV